MDASRRLVTVSPQGIVRWSTKPAPRFGVDSAAAAATAHPAPAVYGADSEVETSLELPTKGVAAPRRCVPAILLLLLFLLSHRRDPWLLPRSYSAPDVEARDDGTMQPIVGVVSQLPVRRRLLQRRGGDRPHDPPILHDPTSAAAVGTDDNLMAPLLPSTSTAVHRAGDAALPVRQYGSAASACTSPAAGAAAGAGAGAGAAAGAGYGATAAAAATTGTGSDEEYVYEVRQPRPSAAAAHGGLAPGWRHAGNSFDDDVSDTAAGAHDDGVEEDGDWAPSSGSSSDADDKDGSDTMEIACIRELRRENQAYLVHFAYLEKGRELDEGASSVVCVVCVCV